MEDTAVPCPYKHRDIKTRYSLPAVPGNADPEALPPFFPGEAEPLDISSQAQPGNQLTKMEEIALPSPYKN